MLAGFIIAWSRLSSSAVDACCRAQAADTYASTVGLAMDVAGDTEALLQNLAAEPAPTDPVDIPAPDAAETLTDAAQDAVEPASAVDAVPAADDAVDGPTPAQAAPDVEDAAAASAMNIDSQPPSSAAATTDTDTVQAAHPAPDAAPVTDTVPEADASAEPGSAPVSAPVSDAATNGVTSTNDTADANGVPAQTEPERGRSRKRRARWGAPANAPKEVAADGAVDGQTGRKKRRSRWEEPAPESEEAQALTVVDTSGGSGFPHEIVLAGGIKVSIDNERAVVRLDQR